MTRKAHHPFDMTLTPAMLPTWTNEQRGIGLTNAAIFGPGAYKPTTSVEDHHV